MGNGDDELGKILIKGFIYALSQMETHPDTILFYNGGAKLTTRSPSDWRCHNRNTKVTAFKELRVGAVFNDLTFVQYDNTVQVRDGGQAMGDNQHGFVRHDVVEAALNQALWLRNRGLPWLRRAP